MTDRRHPDLLVTAMLLLWWILNIVQATFTDLANDEAYYWYFSQHLDWGYYDHPPMVAVLIWLTSWLPGSMEVGVRLATTMLQPLYLMLFWRLIRPPDATRRDALMYVLLCFSQPLLQLYGFLALPDAPLLMCTVLLLWAWRRFCAKTDVASVVLLGLSAALLGYSKYHGALVVLLVVLSQPRMLLRWQLYAAAAVCLVFYAPHLWWQHCHDWASLRYHLVDRAASNYRINYTLEYLATVLVIFNPLWLWHYAKGLRMPRVSDVDRALLFLLVGFVAFFLLSTVRGAVQPQWLLPVVFPCVAFAFKATRRSRYARVVGWTCLGLFLAVRVVAMANPFHLKGELWGQRDIYTAIADLADGRPVQFMHTYTAPPKYTFYTGGEAFCTHYYFNRLSQWQYDTTDRSFTGREVVVGNFTNRQDSVLTLPNGKPFYYSVVPNFHPLREVSIQLLDPVDTCMPIIRSSRGADSIGTLHVRLAVHNPYPYDIYSTDSLPLRLTVYFMDKPYSASGGGCALVDTLRSGATTVIDCHMLLKRPPVTGLSTTGFCLAASRQPSDNSVRTKAAVTHHDGCIGIKVDTP